MIGTLAAPVLRAAVVIVAFATYAFLAPQVRSATAVVGFDAPLGDERRPEAIAVPASMIRGGVASLRGASELRVEPVAPDALRLVVRDVDAQEATTVCARIAQALVDRTAELLPRSSPRDATEAERALARYVTDHGELDEALAPRPRRPQQTDVEKTRLQIERSRVQLDLDRAQPRTEDDTDNPFEQRNSVDRRVLRRRLAEIDGLLSVSARPVTPAPTLPVEFTRLVEAARQEASSAVPSEQVRARIVSPVSVAVESPLRLGKGFLYLGIAAALLAASLPMLLGSGAPEVPSNVAPTPAGVFKGLVSEQLDLAAPSGSPLTRLESPPPGSHRATTQSSNPPPRETTTQSSNPPPRETTTQSSNPPPRETTTHSSNPPARETTTHSSNPPPRETTTHSSNPPARETTTHSSNPPARETTTHSSNPPPAARTPAPSDSSSASPLWAYPVAWQADSGIAPDAHVELAARLRASSSGGCLVVAVVSSSTVVAQKCLVAAGLALALAADEDARVLLLEGDFSHPSVHRILHLDSPANTDFAGQLNARVSQAKEGSWYVVKCSASLHVLPCLQVAPELLLSIHFETCVHQLREFYDFIVINGPSVEDRVGCRALDDVSQGVIVASRVGDPDSAASVFSTKRFWSVVNVS